MKFVSRKRMFPAVVALALAITLASTGFALSNLHLRIGTVANYDFGGYGPGYPIPGTIQIQTFTIRPGDMVPWHYHKAISYVILAHGTLTEQHLIGPNRCASEEMSAGNAFVEQPGVVHNVTNTGHEEAVIQWATVFPKDDGIVQFSREFESGGVYPVTPPNCN